METNPFEKPTVSLDRSGKGNERSVFDQYHGEELPEMECNLPGHTHMASTIQAEDRTWFYVCPTTDQRLIEHE